MRPSQLLNAMPYIPHTETEIQEMRDAIGIAAMEDLFDEIPAELRCGPLSQVPPGVGEVEISRIMHQRAARDGGALCFIGAGAYDHHIPAAVWEITTRGEFYSAYTPYQAEASQGTLQVMYEFQSMMTALTGMGASNASLYDGATALAEAILMAVRLNRKNPSKRVLVPRAVHPAYRAVARSIVHNQGIELVEVGFDPKTGQTSLAFCDKMLGSGIAAMVIPQPNFLGVLEDADALTQWAHGHNAIAIALTNPLALALLQPPGQWGEKGADIACGEAQPLGIPLSSGGPYLGYMCCQKQHVRQLPGRIAGRTVDIDGKPGYTLTLQAREQHIRRSKATSNICTNQGLMMTAATIHTALLGPKGLEQTALACHQTLGQLRGRLTALAGVETVFSGPVFHETVLRLPIPAETALRGLAEHNILGGYALHREYPELGENSVLVCATETRVAADLDHYAETLAGILPA